MHNQQNTQLEMQARYPHSILFLLLLCIFSVSTTMHDNYIAKNIVIMQVFLFQVYCHCQPIEAILFPLPATHKSINDNC